MVTEQEKLAMEKAMAALNFSDNPKTKTVNSKKVHGNPDVDAMMKILENFNSATNSATAKTINEQGVLSTLQQKNNDVVSIGLFEIKIEKEQWNKKRNKNYYSIFNNTGACMFENVALFESATFIVKSLINEDYKQAENIYKLDQNYIKYLRDMRFAKRSQDPIMEAKYSDARYKMLETKEQLKKCLFD
jgi:hypothetical protein